MILQIAFVDSEGSYRSVFWAKLVWVLCRDTSRYWQNVYISMMDDSWTPNSKLMISIFRMGLGIYKWLEYPFILVFYKNRESAIRIVRYCLYTAHQIVNWELCKSSWESNIHSIFQNKAKKRSSKKERWQPATKQSTDLLWCWTKGISHKNLLSSLSFYPADNDDDQSILPYTSIYMIHFQFVKHPFH